MAIQKFILEKVSAYELNTDLSNQNMAMNNYYTSIKNVYINYYVLRSLALYGFKRMLNLEKVLISKSSWLSPFSYLFQKN